MCWIPLHVHSQFSILNSTLSVKKIAKKAKEYSMEAIALTDSGNMFGHVDFYKACRSEGIKPILGCEIRITISRLEKKKIVGMPTSFPIILLAKNKEGYKNLSKISSIGYLEGFYYYPRIDNEILEKYSTGLIALIGIDSYISYLILEKKEEKAFSEILFYQNIFKEDLYFEIKKMAIKEEELSDLKEFWVKKKAEDYSKKEAFINKKLISLSKKLNIKCVATNDIHYLEKDDKRSHEIFLNIQTGEPCELLERDSLGKVKNRILNPKRKVYPSSEFYFKTPDQIKALFSDFIEAVENTKEISDKSDFEFNFKSKHYPPFFPPNMEDKKITKKERLNIVAEYLYDVCLKNIEKKYDNILLEKIKKKYKNDNPLEIIKKRLNKEFEIISSKNLCEYILIVNDFIKWAKSKNILVGPGRGSVSGSIIAYLIGITNIDPISFDLVFERFINPERSSYPDIDVDICMERRQEVINYIIEKYGKDKVAQIITFGTMKAKMAIKDVGRMLSVPLEKVNKIAKLIPEELNITIKKSLELDPELNNMYKYDIETEMIIDIAKKLEGSIRNTSIHAAGIIISEEPINDFIPICTAKDTDLIVTQFAMKQVEALGMLKIDFLGLKTLTSIQKTINLIEQRTNKKIDWTKLPLDDQKTYDLLNTGQTLGIFQLESAGMQELIKKLHIDKFEEIIAVGALYRPGPMDMIPSYINRKHKKEAIEIDHPLVKEILKETYGVMVYQEQVMQIASKLAGYSLAEGDFLRKAIGKKDRKEMSKQKDNFIKGCLNNNIEEEIALTIFEKIEKFASYGFNKSHATAYAYLSYTTAYLKTHFPKEWMASLMTCDRDDISKVTKFIMECKNLNIKILPPDVNESTMDFTATKEGIRFAINGIKGIGLSVVEAIIEEREKKHYSSLLDFIQRIDKRRVGKKNIEILIDAGAFDFTKKSRISMKEHLEEMYEKSDKEQKEKEKGVLTFFPYMEEGDFFKEEKNDNKLDLLKKEKELLGIYLSGHPLHHYKDILLKFSYTPLKDINEKSIYKTAFVIDDIKIKISSSTKRKFAILTISDDSSKFELPIWAEMYNKKINLLFENNLLFAIIEAEKIDENIKLSCHYLEDLTKINNTMIEEYDKTFDQARNRIKTKNLENKNNKTILKIHIDANKISFSKILQLKDLISENSGEMLIELLFFSEEKKIGEIIVDPVYKIIDDENTLNKIKNIPGIIHLTKHF
ncbi:MAG: DNA polymerase III subunit alpha [Chlamydiae bacterium SM23_39]|nr:MAG: DNA polymerase III subunit alpha [Chlamydiae bacterium SM23_39]